MKKEGLIVPAPISGTGLIDTGATTTSIDLAAAESLSLPPTGEAVLGTAGGTVKAPVFVFSVSIGDGRILGETIRGMGCDLTSHGLVVLLGRDLLSHCVFIMNGPDGSFSLSI